MDSNDLPVVKYQRSLEFVVASVIVLDLDASAFYC